MKFILTSLLLASLCASAQTQGPTVSTSPTQPSPTPNSSFLTPNSPDAPATNRPPVVVAPGRAGARDAQALLRKGRHAEAAEAFLSAARGADLQEAEEYRYNAAYAYYTAQDMTNAVQTLRPLLASRKNGALQLGVSTRAAISLLRASQARALMLGRDYVSPDDVQSMAEPVLAHRLVLSPEARMRNMTAERVLSNVIGSVQVPVKAR